MTLCEKIDQYKQKLRNRRDKIVEILKNLDWKDALVKYNGESDDTPEYEVTFGSDELNEIISNGTVENFDVSDLQTTILHYKRFKVGGLNLMMTSSNALN